MPGTSSRHGPRRRRHTRWLRLRRLLTSGDFWLSVALAGMAMILVAWTLTLVLGIEDPVQLATDLARAGVKRRGQGH